MDGWKLLVYAACCQRSRGGSYIIYCRVAWHRWEIKCRERELALDHSLINGTEYWRYRTLSDGNETTCKVERLWMNIGYTKDSIHYFVPINSSESFPGCESSSFVISGWNDNITTPDSTILLHCEPKVHVQDFILQFDPAGQTESYQPAPGSQITDDHFSSEQSSSFTGYDWPGVLTARTYKALEPNPASFNAKLLLRAVESTYTMIFSTYLALSRDSYLEHLSSPRSFANGSYPS
ncbi:hypothetical protein BBP40_003478 [Aspergillus hancockii]|nr:hypothetical protein BBP40_003478 [Aspergillus hancockii]